MASQRKLKHYFMASSYSCDNRVLQGKRTKGGYKTCDTDLKALNNYKYDETMKTLMSSVQYIQQF